MTTDLKHTPGPWANDDGIITASEKRCFVAEVNYGLASGVFDACDANARLIAAAPELLEAAMGALGFIESGNIYDQQCCGGGSECGCRGSTYADEAAHFLRTAIAKAGA